MNCDCYRCKNHTIVGNMETGIDEIICKPEAFGMWNGYIIHPVVQSFISRYGCKLFVED